MDGGQRAESKWSRSEAEQLGAPRAWARDVQWDALQGHGCLCGVAAGGEGGGRRVDRSGAGQGGTSLEGLGEEVSPGMARGGSSSLVVCAGRQQKSSRPQGCGRRGR